MEKVGTFAQMMEQCDAVGAFTAEQVDDLLTLPEPATKHQLNTLQEVMMRKHSTNFSKDELQRVRNAA